MDIHSRDKTLVIPRVHDCIALFLGSDAAYRREFARYPGTYYVSAGWVEGKSQAPSSPHGESPGVSRPRGVPANGEVDADAAESKAPLGSGPTQEEFRRFVEEYGEENVEAIKRFLYLSNAEFCQTIRLSQIHILRQEGLLDLSQPHLTRGGPLFGG